MKKIVIITMFCSFVGVNSVWANQTRMSTLMAGDYIDDLINIDLYPHQIVMYANNLYGDIERQIEDYGIIITPDKKYGAIACWQNVRSNSGFNIGYGVNLFDFNIGISGSPVEDHQRFGIGIGRTFFDKRFDISFLLSNETFDEWYKFNVRLSGRKGDFLIVPKYGLDHVQEPFDYSRHRIGIMLQRLVFKDGFVYFIGEYDFSRGDIEYDYTNVYAGLEMPINKRIALRGGVIEQFTNGFESPTWEIESGFSVRVKEFTLDFHLNKERLFSEYFTLFIFNSFGLDLNFGRF